MVGVVGWLYGWVAGVGGGGGGLVVWRGGV